MLFAEAGLLFPPTGERTVTGVYVQNRLTAMDITGSATLHLYLSFKGLQTLAGMIAILLILHPQHPCITQVQELHKVSAQEIIIP